MYFVHSSVCELFFEDILAGGEQLDQEDQQQPHLAYQNLLLLPGDGLVCSGAPFLIQSAIILDIHS